MLITDGIENQSIFVCSSERTDVQKAVAEHPRFSLLTYKGRVVLVDRILGVINHVNIQVLFSFHIPQQNPLLLQQLFYYPITGSKTLFSRETRT